MNVEAASGTAASAPGVSTSPVFAERALVTLVRLRAQLPHVALSELRSVGRSTATEAVGEIRPLLTDLGFAAPGRPKSRAGDGVCSGAVVQTSELGGVGQSLTRRGSD
ncbi:hypothetical protein [Streptomyces sp. NPDC058385]|uniref:hypothetical protein n=1 Tax=Streptomyces sp. NPDC058385 TaxID=3346473 RepID=UPI00365EC03F